MLIYQPRLTDDQIAEINAALRPHAAFMRTTTLMGSRTAVWGVVADALDYYSHTANVDAETPDEVFVIINIGPKHRIERLGKMRSTSVGDVLLTKETGTDKQGWVCLPFGWLELTPDQINFFLTKVSTHINMGESIR